MKDTSIVNIVLIDDHPLIRLGTKMSLKDNHHVVAEYGSIAEFQTSFKNLTTPVTLVLLDIILSDGSGVEIAEFLRAYFPEVKILVLSVESSEEILLQLMNIGINGFISKKEPADTLCAAIDSVVAGIDFFGKDISHLIYEIKTASKVQDSIFTKRELEIIQYCAKGIFVKQIADQLEISVRTVETHKNNIFKKLGFNSSVELVKYAFEHRIVSN